MKTNKTPYSRKRSRTEKIGGAIGIVLMVLILLAVGALGVYSIRYKFSNENQRYCQSCEAPLEIGDAYCFHCGTAVATQ